MRLSAPDYIAAMHQKGLFSEAQRVPEWNGIFWGHYLSLYKTHIADPADIECVITEAGAGFYRDPMMDAENYSWAMLGPISHAPVPFGAEALICMAAEIAATLSADCAAPFYLRTDLFAPRGDKSGEQAQHFVWINSPQAAIPDNFAAYAESLSGSRRKQMRRLYRDYDGEGGFQFELSERCPDTAELDFAIEHGKARWGDDAGYALAQLLWAIAAARAMPGAARFMRVYKGDKLLFLNSYLVRGDMIVSQSTTRNEQEMFSGLGTMIDFKAIELLCGGAIRTLDPTCRAGLDDPEAIGVAKREIVNRDCVRPLLIIGDDRENVSARFDPEAGWVLPETLVLLGRPL